MSCPDQSPEPPAKEHAAYSLTGAEQAKMLRKLILFWDGQWFLKAVEAFGLDAAVDLNARVRASYGRIEMRTMLKATGKRSADDLPDALRLLQAYSEAFLGTRLRAEFLSIGDRRAEVIVRRCAAYEGAKLASLPRSDQPCIACEGLWPSWFETLLPGSEVSINWPMRQGMGDPYCHFIIELLPDDPS